MLSPPEFSPQQQVTNQLVPIFPPSPTPAPEIPQYEEYDNDYNEYDYNGNDQAFQEPEQPAPPFQSNPQVSSNDQGFREPQAIPSQFQPINPEINANNDYNDYDYAYYDNNNIEQGKY